MYDNKIIYCGKHNRSLLRKLEGEKRPWYVIYHGEKISTQADDLVIIVSEPDYHHRVVKLKKQLVARYVADIVITNKECQFDELCEYLINPVQPRQLAQAVFRMVTTLRYKRELDNLKTSLTLRSQELVELNKIGYALSAERDPDVLLELILSKSREITSADAGSLYLIEKNPDKNPHKRNPWHDKQLRFKLAHNDSISASYREFVMPVEKKSMAGYAAITGKPLNIADAYDLAGKSQYKHNRSFDDKMGYRTRSVLCIPMKNHRGELLGVLQLINRKQQRQSDKQVSEQTIIPFDQRCVELASSLASQAALSIENMQLYEEIKGLFEGFILASVHAIEQRDPTTSGHSQRVAELTIGIASQVDRIKTGRLKDMSFSRDEIQQLKYASLLHDFGKIGVRENVLVKAKKLYPEQLETIKFRFKYAKQALELDLTRQKLLAALGSKIDKLEKYDQELQQKLLILNQYLDFIVLANEPRVMDEGDIDKLEELHHLLYAENGVQKTLVTEQEYTFLAITRGSLGEQERKEIESHVTHTFNFLKRIPWSKNLKYVPEIAYKHHEKLDGTGYPRGLDAEEIPIAARMMTISDIYDALTAWDRPYKKAVPTARALDILSFEVKAGKLDPDLYKIFVGAKIFDLVKKS